MQFSELNFSKAVLYGKCLNHAWFRYCVLRNCKIANCNISERQEKLNCFIDFKGKMSERDFPFYQLYKDDSIYGKVNKKK